MLPRDRVAARTPLASGSPRPTQNAALILFFHGLVAYTIASTCLCSCRNSNLPAVQSVGGGLRLGLENSCMENMQRDFPRLPAFCSFGARRLICSGKRVVSKFGNRQLPRSVAVTGDDVGVHLPDGIAHIRHDAIKCLLADPGKWNALEKSFVRLTL